MWCVIGILTDLLTVKQISTLHIIAIPKLNMDINPYLNYHS